MGVLFVAFTLHAGMTQISGEVMEAASIDGAGAWQRFRDVTLPTLKPLFLILAALSTLWDLRVFTQIFVLQRAGGMARDTNLIGVYAYRVSIGENPLRHRGGRRRRHGKPHPRPDARLPPPDVPPGRAVTGRRWFSNLAVLVVFAVFSFPVYWMVATSFRRGVDVQSRDVQLVPLGGTLENYRKVFAREFFGVALRSSLVVTLLTVTAALVIAFLAAVAISRFRFRGRKSFMSPSCSSARDGLGGICLFGGNLTADITDLCAELHRARPDLLLGLDEEGGYVTRLEAATGSSVPGNAALGAVDDVALTRSVAFALGALLARTGIDLDLAPVADVNVDPANPGIGVRSFGDDPDVVARHVGAFVEGLKVAGVAACAKHFPGHGATRADSHLTMPTVDADAELVARRELVPYVAAVGAGAATIMTAHLLVTALDDRPATSSHRILVDLLRRELGFAGAVVTDALDVGGIGGPGHIPVAVVDALRAGGDLCGLGPGATADLVDASVAAVAAVVAAVRAGDLAEERLGEAAHRVTGIRLAPAPTAPTARSLADVGAEAARRALHVEGDLPAPLDGALVIELRRPGEHRCRGRAVGRRAVPRRPPPRDRHRAPQRREHRRRRPGPSIGPPPRDRRTRRPPGAGAAAGMTPCSPPGPTPSWPTSAGRSPTTTGERPGSPSTAPRGPAARPLPALSPASTRPPGGPVAEITLRGVTKRHDNDVLAVDHVDLDVVDRELPVLVDPSRRRVGR
jgi:beta-N-acetylhexosaminidase